jgi:hypothetical protein
MMLYAATLRLVNTTKAQAEYDVSIWQREYKPGKPAFDGTIQFSVDSLPASDQHVHVSDETPLTAESVEAMLGLAFRQGQAYAIRGQVSPKWQ